MKKLFLTVLALTGVAAGMAWASSVTTSDGQNFNVTNDVGVTAPYTLNSINQQVIQANASATRDEQTFLKDSEIAYTWVGVQQMAVNAQAAWQANQQS